MKTRDMVLVALFAAIVAVLGLLPKIQLLSGVPITAQSLGVMLAGGILGARRGGAALVLFVILVLAGLPLMAGGRGGLGLLYGPSGGFILAFPVAACAVGWFVEANWQRLSMPLSICACLFGGVIVLYAIGVPWMAVAGQFKGLQALTIMLPFLPGDVIKAVLSAVMIMSVKRAYPIIGTATMKTAG